MGANEDEVRADQMIATDPPRDNLVRGTFPADLELREVEGDGMPTMRGHFAVFDEWTEINSVFEGRFLERISAGAFRKTIRENSANMRVLFQHGKDPQIGAKPLGAINVLREDDQGAYYEVPLFDTSYNRDLVEPLRAGTLGASFNFRVMKEEFRRDAEKSAYNPEGLPERTITEAKVMEFGPVTFPAYTGATAGVRSLTDELVYGQQSQPVFLPEAEDEKPPHSDDSSRDTLEVEGLEPTHSVDESPEDDATAGSRDTPPPPVTETDEEEQIMASIGEMRARQKEIQGELEEIAADFAGAILDGSARARWDKLTDEMEDLGARIKEERARREYLEALAADDENIEGPEPAPVARSESASNGSSGGSVYVTHRDGKLKAPDNPHDITEYQGRARDHDQLMDLYREGARKAIDSFRYPHERADSAQLSSNVERLLDVADSPDKVVARRVITCGSTVYRRAFWKTIAKKPLNSEEQRAMLTADAELRTEAYGLTTGGAVVAVPIQIDPTVLLTSNGVLNPIRAISRNVQTTSYAWQGVTTGGVTAQYQAEGVTMLNNAGTFNNPTIYVERVTSFIPYSWEIAQDFGGLEAELAREISDARDTLEATKFALGAGHSSNEPQGILVGAGTVITTSGGTFGTAMSSDDLFTVEAALPPRHVPQAAWVSSVGVYQRIRKEDSAGGGRFWVDLRDGQPASLIGYPAYKSSTIGTSVAAGGAPIAGAIWGVFGNWNRYVVVDRPGLFVRNIDTLFGGTAAVHFPTGQGGIVGFWRNSAGVVDSGAFRVGTVSKGVN